VVTIVEETTRVCKVCGIEKPIGDFPRLQGKWRYRACKKCYYARHRDNVIERAKRYYYNHRSEVLGKLRRDNLSIERRVVLQKRDKENNERVRRINLETYGTACSPTFTAKIRENERQKRAVNKLETGYVYPEALREKRELHYLEMRKRALQYYGGKCECCGESRYEMLTFDHKVKTHYKDKVRGVALVYEVIKTYHEFGYPNEQYRVLCWNCNTTRGFYGYCPHKSGYNTTQDIPKRRITKLEMIQAYGGHCVLCGEEHWEFLTIDHINGGGTEHRRSIGSKHIYVWLKERGWPKNGYRLLCANCNCSEKSNKRVQEVKS